MIDLNIFSPEFAKALESFIEKKVGQVLENKSLAQQPSAPKYLNVKQMAQLLNLTEATIYKMTSKNEIPFHKPKNGKKVYFIPEEIDLWMANGRVKTNQELDEEYDKAQATRTNVQQATSVRASKSNATNKATSKKS